ncbi:hypothetical protein HU200_066047 [Digitaria exilis]|uniref:Uncharacterized protein n=1 Tax=Digitaria exilis TaxID=1010633 RepID=A0A835DUA7_9POAL|nr:hypothetical protein HU200_066047 [Digitaria exilis]
MLHMIAKCSYSAQVWNIMATGTDFQIPPPTGIRRVIGWELISSTGLTHAHTQLIIYTLWNLWKERCRRVFDNKTLSPIDLARVIKEEIAAEQLATRQN